MRTDEQLQQERSDIATELRDVRAEGQPYEQPWEGLSNDGRWARAQVWEGTDGEVHVQPGQGRGYILRGRIIGPAHQRHFMSMGDVLIVDVGPGGIGNNPRLHMTPLDAVVLIRDPGPDFEPGLDEDYPI